MTTYLLAQALDFEGDRLTAPLALTRAALGSYTDHDGSLKTAAANEPRYDWSAGERALLLEAASTNLTSRSVASVANWTNTSAVLTDMSLNALGVFTGLAVASAGATWHRASLQNNVSYAAGTDYTVTVWYAPGTVSTAMLSLYSAAIGVDFVVSGAAGALAATKAVGGVISAVVNTDMGGGYFRVSVTYRIAASGYVAWGIGPGSAVAGESIIALGAQIEAGTSATSYIATNGAAAPRAADIASIDLAPGNYDVRTMLDTGSVDALGVVHGGGAYWPAAAVGRVRSVQVYRSGSYTPLLPPNATALERALEALVVQMFALDVPVDSLWAPARCPAALLPYLAWALSVDEWDASWSAGRQREVIAAALEIQRHKGTPWAIKRTLEVLGYGTATLVERYGARPRDGSVPRNGSEVYAAADHWAEYRVILDQPITIEQAARVRKVLATVAPAHCALKALDYVRALNIYNGTVPRAGTYTRGVA